jgi:hypothetical protein
MGEVWSSVLFRYPGALAWSSTLGIVKATFSHNVNDLGIAIGSPWVPPGTGSLLNLRREAFENLSKNHPILIGAFLYQLIYVPICLGLTLIGLHAMVKGHGNRRAGLVLFVLFLYFYLLIGLFGIEAYCRCRLPVLPFQAIFAGVGLASLIRLLASNSGDPAGCRVSPRLEASAGSARGQARRET